MNYCHYSIWPDAAECSKDSLCHDVWKVSLDKSMGYMPESYSKFIWGTRPESHACVNFTSHGIFSDSRNPLSNANLTLTLMNQSKHVFMLKLKC